MVEALLVDLAACPGVARVIVTHNIDEPDVACPPGLARRLQVVRNARPQGFAANQNQAFQHCETPLFAVLNPDIRLPQDPFPPLAAVLEDSRTGLAAPRVLDAQGRMEDSVRYFPTPWQLAGRVLGWADGRYPVAADAPTPVEWVAGMFMLLRAEAFRRIGGFDDGFFLYCEDVDICVRLWKAGLRVVVHPGVAVVHQAQRASRRRARYLAWHLSSLARYFGKHLGRLPRVARGE